MRSCRNRFLPLYKRRLSLAGEEYRHRFPTVVRKRRDTGRRLLKVSEFTSRIQIQVVMNGNHLALGLLLLVLVASAAAREPACPQLRCRGGNKVACFVDNRCQCRCVTDRDPCASLLGRPCPKGRRVRCTSDGNHCTCRCAR